MKPARSSVKKKPSTPLRTFALDAKQLPSQRRSMDTFELILSVSATLLGEIGVESLSTNVICKRAGLTPPALYRYFPNKYAILRELGARLMDRQNESYLAWLAEQPAPGAHDTNEQRALRLQSMQTAINDITLAFPSAAWIMRALRAVPALQPVRLQSHAFVAERAFAERRKRFPHADEAQLRLATRLSTEVMYAATEMVLDNPDLDASRITAEVSDMVVRYFSKFDEGEVKRARTPAKPRALAASGKGSRTVRKPAR